MPNSPDRKLAVNVLSFMLLLLEISSDIAKYVSVLASLSVASHSITVLHTVNNGFDSFIDQILAPNKGSAEQNFNLHSCLIQSY